MDYIRFSVDGQRLDYDRKYYSSTDTIDTLYCNFKFETDDLGHILGGWDLPYLWAQFHDEEGNVYIKAVTDNTCSIPHKCLRQLKFKMTLFATDKEDYMTCEKRYTTNEIAFKFKGRANLNYDDGVSPDEPVPSQWQLLLDRVDECESTVDTLSQDVTAIGGRVDGLSQDVTNIDDKVDTVSQTVATMGDKVDSFDSRVTANTTAIDGLTQDVTSIHGDLDDLSTSLENEVTARADGDTRLEGLIDDEVTAREQLDTDVRRWFTEESNARVNGDNNLQNNINSLETTVRSNYSSSMSRMDSLDSRITGDASAISGLNSRVTNNANAIEGINTTVDGLSTDLADESTARETADTRLEGLIGDRYTKTETDTLINAESTARANADAELQSAIQAEATTRSEAIKGVNGTVNELNTKLDDESTARANADTRLESLIGDRYTKTETDALLDAESAAREAADTNLQTLINNRYTKAETDALLNGKADVEDIPDLTDYYTKTETDTLLDAKQNSLNESQLATVNSGLTSSDKTTLDGLDSRVTTNTNDIATLDEQVEELKKASGGGIDGTGAGFHSSIYRGKYLGDTYTDAQKAAITNGTFDDLFIGDYWTINGVNWRIADFDYYYNVGDTAFIKHHVIIVPDTILYEAKMKSTNSTSYAYSGSEMCYANLDKAKTAFTNAFGRTYIAMHRCQYANSVSSGVADGAIWSYSRVELMSEEQVYGHAVWGKGGYDVGTQKTQFKLFAFDQTKINIRDNYWLTNVVDSYDYACVGISGDADRGSAASSYGVRPFACLTGE